MDVYYTYNPGIEVLVMAWTYSLDRQNNECLERTVAIDIGWFFSTSQFGDVNIKDRTNCDNCGTNYNVW